MIKYLKISLFLIAFVARQKQKEESVKQPVNIPKTELLADNKGFGWQQDVLFFEGKPYWGYVLEKYPSDQKNEQGIPYFHTLDFTPI